MNEEESTVYRGYIHANYCKEFYVKENNVFMEYIDAKHLYYNVKRIECFDSDSNYLGMYEEEKPFSKRETRKTSDISLTVRQVGYNFHLFSGSPWKERTIDEVCRLENKMNNSQIGSFDVGYNYDFERNPGTKMFESQIRHTKKPIEVVTVGCSRCVTRNSIKEFINIDFRKYIERKNKFIKENPELKETTECIFRMNVNNLCNYLMCSPEKLFSRTFNKSDQMVKRLMYKINNK